MAAASLVGASPVTAKRDGWARFLDLWLYPASQLARADLPGCRHARFFSVPLLFLGFTEADRQWCHFRQGFPAKIHRIVFRSDPLSSGVVLHILLPRLHNSLLHTSSKH